MNLRNSPFTYTYVKRWYQLFLGKALCIAEASQLMDIQHCDVTKIRSIERHEIIYFVFYTKYQKGDNLIAIMIFGERVSSIIWCRFWFYFLQLIHEVAVDDGFFAKEYQYNLNGFLDFSTIHEENQRKSPKQSEGYKRNFGYR